MSSPIRILLADDHAIFCRGVCSLLSEFDDLQVVAEAGTSPATLRGVAEHHPDVVLLDVQMGGANGIEVARELRRMYPDLGIIILTSFDNDEYLFGALQVGANAYLLKDVALHELPKTVRAVARGERLLSPQLIDRTLRQFQKLASERIRRESGLDQEDLRILEMVAEGATNQQIADALFWSEITVKKRMQEITRKLGASNRSQAVALAIRRGLI
jgi:DNA-binding NarL/FixJ family response regulator